MGMKIRRIFLTLLIVIALSGCIRLEKTVPADVQKSELISTPIPSSTLPTSILIRNVTPIPTIIKIPTPPQSSPISEPMVVATPTGRIVITHVAKLKFEVPNLQINAGDAIIWDNFDGSHYTIVEMDKKIANITLNRGEKVKYIFNTTGNYSFGLYYQFMRIDPSIQKISVGVNLSE
jgi:hypothetical protein